MLRWILFLRTQQMKEVSWFSSLEMYRLFVYISRGYHRWLLSVSVIASFMTFVRWTNFWLHSKVSNRWAVCFLRHSRLIGKIIFRGDYFHRPHLNSPFIYIYKENRIQRAVSASNPNKVRSKTRAAEILAFLKQLCLDCRMGSNHDGKRWKSLAGPSRLEATKLKLMLSPRYFACLVWRRDSPLMK